MKSADIDHTLFSLNAEKVGNMIHEKAFWKCEHQNIKIYIFLFNLTYFFF